MTTVYLAGAMDKVSPDFAIEWRQEAKGFLKPKGFEVLDPTEDKDLWKPGVHTVAYKPEEIVTADLKMISAADIILAELCRRDIPYHGTSMELVYACQWEKAVYVWGGCRSYWVRYHSDMIFEQLIQALEYINHFFGGD